MDDIYIKYKDYLIKWPYALPQNGDIIILTYPVNKKKCEVEVKYKIYTLDENNSLKHITIIVGSI